MTSVRRERARPMSAATRRAAIIAATLPLLAEHGGQVTTRQIAEAAGVAEGTIFRVFDDKRSLLLAVAEETMNPPGAREEMRAELAVIPELRDKVTHVVTRLVARMERGMLVMMALRSVFMSERSGGPPAERAGPPGPPAFVTEANQQLTRNLTDLVFTPHAQELRVPPARAALVLRSLVFGAWHPGMPHGDTQLTPADVADQEHVGVVAVLYLPSLNADIIDNGIVRGDTGYILRIGAVMLAVSLVQIVCSVGAVWFGARTAMSVGRDIRAAVFHRVGTFSAREVQQFGAPSLITRTTNDVQQVQMLVLMACTIAVTSPIMMVGGVVMALREDAGLGWILAVVVPTLFVTVGLVVSRMVPNFRRMQTRIDEVNRVLREQITGIRVVRAFVREPHEATRFATANDDLTEVAVRAGRWMATMFPLVMLVVNVSSVAVIWFGGHRVDSGQMQVGALTAFLSYLMQILMSVMMATFMLMMIPRSAVCGDRIMQVLDTESSVVPPSEPVRPDVAKRGWLDAQDVTFSYPGAESPVLSGVSFSARPGQTVAIIGSTGAGKSTLVNLVPRLFDATGGTVAVGGIDVRRLDPDALWDQIGLVPQRAYLFSGTIAGNLRHGKPDATEDEMWAALETAQAREFVAELADGLAAKVVQGGTNFSGGQRQRLAIARALIRKPGVYLFDDSFSALDLATDARLRAALRPTTTDSTVVIVAQRVSTITDADLIIVLEDGRVVGRGTHDELLAGCPTYQEIVVSQQAAEVAA